MQIAILIPCFNEEITIGKTICDFRKELPDAEIYVFDNNSTDNTALIAKKEGAIVIKEKRQGKGFVIQSMLNKINADLYVMVDGDDTYSASHVHNMIKFVLNDEADMVVGARLHEYTKESFRHLHVFGNRLVIMTINMIFGTNLKDVMSGYRVFNSEVANSLPVLSKGFEVETEITIQMLDKNFVVKEIVVPYKERPEGSHSKLSTFKDGFKVLWTIFRLFKDYKPLTFFGSVGLTLLFCGQLLSIQVINEYVQHKYVYKLPTFVGAVGISISGLLSISLGLILTTVNHRLKEINQLLLRNKHKNWHPSNKSKSS